MASRFIPAGAGNTASSVVQIPTQSVHPRGCGEYVTYVLANSFCSVHPRGCGEYAMPFDVWYGIVGSSPRVRGILP